LTTHLSKPWSSFHKEPVEASGSNVTEDERNGLPPGLADPALAHPSRETKSLSAPHKGLHRTLSRRERAIAA